MLVSCTTLLVHNVAKSRLYLSNAMQYRHSALLRRQEGSYGNQMQVSLSAIQYETSHLKCLKDGLCDMPIAVAPHEPPAAMRSCIAARHSTYVQKGKLIISRAYTGFVTPIFPGRRLH